MRSTTGVGEYEARRAAFKAGIGYDPESEAPRITNPTRSHKNAGGTDADPDASSVKPNPT